MWRGGRVGTLEVQYPDSEQRMPHFPVRSSPLHPCLLGHHHYCARKGYAHASPQVHPSTLVDPLERILSTAGVATTHGGDSLSITLHPARRPDPAPPAVLTPRKPVSPATSRTSRRARTTLGSSRIQVSSYGAWIPNGRLYKGLRICLVHDCSRRTWLRGDFCQRSKSRHQKYGVCTGATPVFCRRSSPLFVPCQRRSAFSRTICGVTPAVTAAGLEPRKRPIHP